MDGSRDKFFLGYEPTRVLTQYEALWPPQSSSTLTVLAFITDMNVNQVLLKPQSKPQKR